MGVGVGRCEGAGGSFEVGAETVGGRNTHSSDGGATLSARSLPDSDDVTYYTAP